MPLEYFIDVLLESKPGGIQIPLFPVGSASIYVEAADLELLSCFDKSSDSISLDGSNLEGIGTPPNLPPNPPMSPNNLVDVGNPSNGYSNGFNSGHGAFYGLEDLRGTVVVIAQVMWDTWQWHKWLPVWK